MQLLCAKATEKILSITRLGTMSCALRSLLLLITNASSAGGGVVLRNEMLLVNMSFYVFY